MNTPLLQVQDLKISYGGIEAVKGIALEIFPNELVTLIGANGSGKTSTLKAICALLPMSSGDIRYFGQSIRDQKTFELLRAGLVMVPEGRGIFTRMTVLENLQIGAYARRDRHGIKADIERMLTIFPRLKERAKQLAGTLSGGEQQMLAITRALMSQPKLLLLDEPSMGLSPIMVAKVFEVIGDISAQGTTILLVEQNAHLALKAAHRAYVMESGMITLSGKAHGLLDDARIRSAYLGE